MKVNQRHLDLLDEVRGQISRADYVRQLIENLDVPKDETPIPQKRNDKHWHDFKNVGVDHMVKGKPIYLKKCECGESKIAP